MKQEIAEAIEAYSDDVQARTYSGRGMMGRSEYGVVGSQTSIISAIGHAIHDMTLEDAPEVADILESLDSLRFDSMGRDVIVY